MFTRPAGPPPLPVTNGGAKRLQLPASSYQISKSGAVGCRLTPDLPFRMPKLIEAPSIIVAAGNKPKRIEEYAGRVNSGHSVVSVAKMTSPAGWEEPGQRPQFEEITVVLRGMLRVECEGTALAVRAGQAVVTQPGEWVRYSTPEPEGAEYIAVCIPAFSPDTVHRDS